jgi:hypothetical protein
MTYPELERLGDALERAVAVQVRTPAGPRRSRKLIAGVAVLAVAVPGLAFAAKELISEEEVALGLPAGTHALRGTDPHCSVVKQDVEYRCVLSRPPAPETEDWKNAVEPTVDATKHVNGGCRSLRSDGLVWECFLGEAAIREQIISRDFLGAYAPVPGRG